VSYMLDGKQYVSLLAGPPLSSRLYTFVLDGKAAMPAITNVSANPPVNTDPTVLLNRVCTGCHALEVVTNSKMDRASWKGTVDNMVARGAVATSQEMSIITDYLARTYPVQ
jgi:hypothetical protein